MHTCIDIFCKPKLVLFQVFRKGHQFSFLKHFPQGTVLIFDIFINYILFVSLFK